MKKIIVIVAGLLYLSNSIFADAICMAETESGKTVELTYRTAGSIGWGVVSGGTLTIKDKVGKVIFNDKLLSTQNFSEAYNGAEFKEEQLVSVILRAQFMKAKVELVFVGANSIDQESLVEQLRNPKRISNKGNSLLITIKGGKTYSFKDIICAVEAGDT